MVTASIFAIFLPVFLSIGALAVWWSAAVPRLAIALLGFSLVVGQLIRLPLPGQGGGLLLSDIAVVLVIGAALFQVVRSQKRITDTYALSRILLLLIIPFFIWSACLLAMHAPELGGDNTMIAAAYWVRLFTHCLVLPALLVLFQDANIRQFSHRALIAVIVAIVGLGFLQVFVFPNLTDLSGTVSRVAPFLNGAQWDPHSGRLVSTWFDPNFVGGFLVLATFYLGFRKQYVLFGFTLLALLLTQSRSSFVAIGSILMLSPFLILHGLSTTNQHRIRATRIAVGIALILVVGGAVAINLGSRFTDVFISDPTVELRVTSLQATWRALAKKTFLIGEGYNAYQFAAAREGLITSFTTHSRAGSDTSLLTLWVTTGIVGVVLFLLPWMYGLLISWRRAWQKTNVTHFIPIAAFLALCTHALFINSLLYGHLIIMVCFLFALSLSERSHETPL